MSTTMEVPESQRLIAVSLGKIAASRSQKGGINLHKNLLVATVLHKARTAYMIQHFARQRAVAQSSPPPPSSTTSVEMREQQPQQQPPASDSAASSAATTTTTAAAPPTFLAAPTVTGTTHSASVDAAPETGSVPDGADVSAVQVAKHEDKENTPPPTSSSSSPSTTASCGGDATLSPHCENRLHGDSVAAMDTQTKDFRDREAAVSSLSASPRSLVVSHAQNNSRQDYVSPRKCPSSPTNSSSSSSSCLLKRRRTMDSNHENVSAPKVRIVEARLSVTDSNPEPMQCDSPQISNLVNIFSSSFAGLSGAAAGGDVSVRSVGQSLLSTVAAGHKVLSDNMTCAKEMKLGLDSSVRQPLVLSV